MGTHTRIGDVSNRAVRSLFNFFLSNQQPSVSLLRVPLFFGMGIPRGYRCSFSGRGCWAEQMMTEEMMQEVAAELEAEAEAAKEAAAGDVQMT